MYGLMWCSEADCRVLKTIKHFKTNSKVAENLRNAVKVMSELDSRTLSLKKTAILNSAY